MSKIELLQKRLENYYKAESAVLNGQSYQIGTKRLQRADLSEIRSAIKELEDEIATAENGGKRHVLRVVPRDL